MIVFDDGFAPQRALLKIMLSDGEQIFYPHFADIETVPYRDIKYELRGQ